MQHCLLHLYILCLRSLYHQLNPKSPSEPEPKGDSKFLAEKTNNSHEDMNMNTYAKLQLMFEQISHIPNSHIDHRLLSWHIL